MPIISVARDELMRRLQADMSYDEFEHLCFSFGIELDDVLTEEEEAKRAAADMTEAEATAEEESKAAEAADPAASGKAAAAATAGSDKLVYRIEVPANRYDILSLEGLVRALNIFRGVESMPKYKLADLGGRPMLSIKVGKETAAIRPFVVCAVLRNVKLDAISLKSFITLQDKLHFNICRRRTLVAIGTHDLDTIQGPFRYDAKEPKDIEFVPLSHSESYTADKLLEHFETDPEVKHIKPYVPIIKDAPRYPVITDSTGRVLSLPPIINGDHSKNTIDTRNIFIECTATDLAKANTVLNTIVCTYSYYCEEPFVVEPVRVEYEDESFHAPYVTPDLSYRPMRVSIDDACSMAGAEFTREQAAEFATKMGLDANVLPTDEEAAASVTPEEEEGAEGIKSTRGWILCSVPPTRSDVIHACDVHEDLAIAYGYNKIVPRIPATATVGAGQPVNLLSDLLRHEIAYAGYEEVLTMALCSRADNYTRVGHEDDGKAVGIANPKTKDFQIVRTRLLPGLLMTLRENKSARGLGITSGVRLFEISDVCETSESADADTGAVNRRELAALYAGPTAGFEVVRGLLDTVMTALEVQYTPGAKSAEAAAAVAAEAGAGTSPAPAAEYLLKEYAAACTKAAEAWAKKQAGDEEDEEDDAGDDEDEVAGDEGEARALREAGLLAADPSRLAGRGGLRYYIVEGRDPTYFPGRCGLIVVERCDEGSVARGAPVVLERRVLGRFGIVHPKVFHNFDLNEYPGSGLELDIDQFVRWHGLEAAGASEGAGGSASGSGEAAAAERADPSSGAGGD